MSNDPLDKIFSKPEEIDLQRKKILADILNPYARIDVENGTFMPTILWANLGSKEKILVFLIARLALSTRNNLFTNCVTPKDVEIETEIPGGTVRPKIIELYEDKLITKNDTGGYYVKSTLTPLLKIKSFLEIKNNYEGNS